MSIKWGRAAAQANLYKLPRTNNPDDQRQKAADKLPGRLKFKIASRFAASELTIARIAIERNSFWLAAIIYAILACTIRDSVFSDTWWLVYVPLWAAAFSARRADSEQRPSVMMTITALILFAWLFFVTQSAALEASGTWRIDSNVGWLRALSLPLRATFAGVVSAVLLTIPIQRIAGPNALYMACVIGSMYAVAKGYDIVSSVSLWSKHAYANVFFLYAKVAPPLFLIAACRFYKGLPLSRAWVATAARLGDWCRLLWMGQVNAASVFFGVFCPTLALLLVAMYERNKHLDWLMSATGSSIYALTFVIAFVTFAFAVISVWRSLARFKRHNILAANVSELGQIIVAVIAAPLLIYGALYELPDTAETVRNGLRLVPGRAWQVVVDGNLLRVSGEFTLGIGKAVESAIVSNPGIRVVVLESPGGDIAEGYRIARAVKLHDLSTAVSHQCESACTDAFVAGRERILIPHTRLGFHACRQRVWYSECNDREYEAFMSERGIDPRFVQKAMAVPASSMWFPTVDELTAAHVVTRTTKPIFDSVPTNGQADTRVAATLPQ